MYFAGYWIFLYLLKNIFYQNFAIENEKKKKTIG